MLRVLTFSTLYPNAAQPRHGIFVEERLRHLVASGRVFTRVIAPVPWFPSTHPMFGEFARFARVPARELRHGIEILHPRYPVIPRFGMTLAPALMQMSLSRLLRREIEHGGFDLIDAHYFFPDGVAAVNLAHRHRIPVLVTARGTDVNLIPRYPAPRRMIRRAAGSCDAVITVCQALKDRLVELGVSERKVSVLRNGVDLERFRPLDREQLRGSLGFIGHTLLSVGHLIGRKGHHIAISALRQLPDDVRLVLVGDGPKERELRQQAQALRVADRVTFAGARTQAELVQYYNAADTLVLASDREGMANVLLESMACGTPVIATALWGTPEVVNSPAAGELMHSRTPAALADAWRRLVARAPERSATRAHAEGFAWAHTTRGQLELFERVLERRRASNGARVGQSRA